MSFPLEMDGPHMFNMVVYPAFPPFPIILEKEIMLSTWNINLVYVLIIHCAIFVVL